MPRISVAVPGRPAVRYCAEIDVGFGPDTPRCKDTMASIMLIDPLARVKALTQENIAPAGEMECSLRRSGRNENIR